MLESYRFDPYELHPAKRLLTRLDDGKPVALGARAFDVLACLVQHHGRVVSKNDLLTQVWGVQVVEENNLSVQVAAIRRALGKQAIATVARRGFRFGWQVLESARPQVPMALPEKPSIAVLSFDNMSPESALEPVGDGLAEDITTELSRFHNLFVISRNSAFTYKGRAFNVRDVGRELGVRYVLEGSVRQAGGRIRITAQLIDAVNGNHLWAEKYDRDLDDAFDVQTEVTRAIVSAIAPEIELAEWHWAGGKAPANLNAHSLAMRGWFVLRTPGAATQSAVRDESVRLAREALALDSRCAAAWRTIASAQWHNVYQNTVPSRSEALAVGIEAAQNAIEVDSADNFAHGLNGLLLFMAGEAQAGLAALRRSHQINPNDAFTCIWLGFYEAASGDAAVAIDYCKAALRLSPSDPARPNFLYLLAAAYTALGDYTNGLTYAQASLAESPGTPGRYVAIAVNQVGLGDIDAAAQAYAQAKQLAPALVEARLAGHWMASSPKYLARVHTFFRIAAGLESPAAAMALR